MTETVKERIENEIKSVEKRLHRGRNDGKTYNTGVKEGLMIARAHVIDSVSTDKLSVEKLQEQLNTAKKALTEIEDVKRRLEQTTDFGVGFQPTYNALEFVVAESKKALAAIGGDGCPVGPVGKNGLTKEELEGSGDE